MWNCITALRKTFMIHTHAWWCAHFSITRWCKIIFYRTRLGHLVAVLPVTLTSSSNPYFVAEPVCHSVKSCNYFLRRTKLETYCQKLNRDLIQFPILGFFVQKENFIILKYAKMIYIQNKMWLCGLWTDTILIKTPDFVEKYSYYAKMG